MNRFRFTCCSAAILILITACGQQASLPPAQAEQDLPNSDLISTQKAAIAPSFTQTPDSSYLQWLEPLDSGYRMMKAVWNGKNHEWSLPIEIFRHRQVMANAHDIPGMAICGVEGMPRQYVWWHENSPAGEYKYNIRVNADGDAPLGLHPDLPAGEHAFVSAAPTRDGRIAFAWLQNHPDPDAPDSVHAPTQLCFKFFPSPQAQAPVIVDSMVCDCCPTEMVATETGFVLAYRDRDANEIRDIKVRVYAAGKWSEPIEIGQEHWKMNGCPVNGAALAASDSYRIGSTVELIWFTAENGNSRIRRAKSHNSGMDWAVGPDLAAQQPLGQVDLASSANGTWASWVEQDTAHGGTRIVLQSLSQFEKRFVVARLPGDAPACRPMLTIIDHLPVVAWAHNGIHTCVVDPAESPMVGK